MYVAAKAREVGHHPDIDIGGSGIRFGITTHDAGHRIMDLDFALARHIDAIAARARGEACTGRRRLAASSGLSSPSRNHSPDRSQPSKPAHLRCRHLAAGSALLENQRGFPPEMPISAAVNCPVSAHQRPDRPPPGRRSERRSHRLQSGTPEKSDHSARVNGHGACPSTGSVLTPRIA